VSNAPSEDGNSSSAEASPPLMMASVVHEDPPALELSQKIDEAKKDQ
jgi:hypothetical protein